MKPVLAILFIALLIMGSTMAEEDNSEPAPPRQKRQHAPRVTETKTEWIAKPGKIETVQITETRRG